MILVSANGSGSSIPRGPITYRFGSASPYESLILREANKHQLDPYLIAAVIIRESRGNRFARGKSGEYGLMQVMPVHVKYPVLLYDPSYNIQIGSAYLRQMINKRGGNIRSGLSAYNTGPNGAYNPRYVRDVEVVYLALKRFKAKPKAK